MEINIVEFEDPFEFFLEEKAYFWYRDANVDLESTVVISQKNFAIFEINFEDDLSEEGFPFFFQLMIIGDYSKTVCFLLNLIFFHILETSLSF